MHFLHSHLGGSSSREQPLLPLWEAGTRPGPFPAAPWPPLPSPQEPTWATPLQQIPTFLQQIPIPIPIPATLHGPEPTAHRPREKRGHLLGPQFKHILNAACTRTSGKPQEGEELPHTILFLGCLLHTELRQDQEKKTLACRQKYSLSYLCLLIYTKAKTSCPLNYYYFSLLYYYFNYHIITSSFPFRAIRKATQPNFLQLHQSTAPLKSPLPGLQGQNSIFICP